jgi:hypothetical protein
MGEAEYFGWVYNRNGRNLPDNYNNVMAIGGVVPKLCNKVVHKFLEK